MLFIYLNIIFTNFYLKSLCNIYYVLFRQKHSEQLTFIVIIPRLLIVSYYIRLHNVNTDGVHTLSIIETFFSSTKGRFFFILIV